MSGYKCSAQNVFHTFLLSSDHSPSYQSETKVFERLPRWLLGDQIFINLRYVRWSIFHPSKCVRRLGPYLPSRVIHLLLHTGILFTEYGLRIEWQTPWSGKQSRKFLRANSSKNLAITFQHHLFDGLFCLDGILIQVVPWMRTWIVYSDTYNSLHGVLLRSSSDQTMQRLDLQEKCNCIHSEFGSHLYCVHVLDCTCFESWPRVQSIYHIKCEHSPLNSNRSPVHFRNSAQYCYGK